MTRSTGRGAPLVRASLRADVWRVRSCVSVCAFSCVCVQSLAGREPCRAKLDLHCAVLLLASEDVVCVVRAGASDTSLRSSHARVRSRL